MQEDTAKEDTAATETPTVEASDHAVEAVAVAVGSAADDAEPALGPHDSERRGSESLPLPATAGAPLEAEVAPTHEAGPTDDVVLAELATEESAISPSHLPVDSLPNSVGEPDVAQPEVTGELAAETTTVTVDPVASIAVGAEVVGAEVVGAEVVGAEVVGAEVVEVAAVEAAVVVPEVVFTYQPGDIIPGIITVIGPNGIEADLGEGELAVIPKAELVDGHEPEIGEQIEGTVVRHQAGSGRYVISPKRAHRTRSWTKIEAAFEAGEPISGVVKSTTKGGLILDLGIRAFLPESLVDVRKVPNLASLVGTTMTVKIIECEKITGEQAAIERRSEKIVVNRRVMLEVERQAERAVMFSTVKVGDRRTGTITALTDFGAFVDIGGGEGLIHVSELAHRQVAKPSDVVTVGDQVEVIVLDVKPERNKISLSRKAALPNPWDQFSQLHKIGDLVFGTVTGLAAFGVFVTIEGEGFEPVEGLVHISELSRFRVEQASDVVAVGEGVWSQILSIDPDKRRVALSMRRALE